MHQGANLLNEAFLVGWRVYLFDNSTACRKIRRPNYFDGPCRNFERRRSRDPAVLRSDLHALAPRLSASAAILAASARVL
ncbi:hypothetical protein PSAC2689_120038 [Paraburkholderia sacchari]